MPITANDPNKKSWLFVNSDSDFPIQNIPFGVFKTKNNTITVGTRIGDFAIDLNAMHQLNYFEGIELPKDIFAKKHLISGSFFLSKKIFFLKKTEGVSEILIKPKATSCPLFRK